MVNRPALARVSRFFKWAYLKLFRINDTPQRIALGLGLGVFTGVLPGTGPIAALALAFILRVNRASALLGSIITNTWLGIPVFMLSLRVGASVAGVSYQDLNRDWQIFIKGFQWDALLSMGLYKILIPVLAGYALISLAIGAITYIVALVIVGHARSKRR
ncbi:MAG: DUF2062 domain-containing protein [Candidatus Omnitrophica bacterium]|nr:DUF2062 domain-containing protein [Candidatus Omnitrophota bacterium]MBU0880991.1 DUF2062 domain-containing protein [Candidatus Omnitrophota bacterium]MBU1808091.1 DUF2062 domain-containing protein [Candidatus Omnitrophota bacterium]